MRQSIEYSLTANRAILDYASRYRERVLFDIYKMGRDEIQWGNEDHWTFTPHEMARVQEGLVARGVVTASEIPGAASTITPAGRGSGRGGNAGGGGTEVGAGRGGGRGESPLYAALTAPELRDPRGFVIPSDQPDFGTATKFVNTLMKTGITIHRATAPFTVEGNSYPANSYVVKTAQAFRPHGHLVVRFVRDVGHHNDALALSVRVDACRELIDGRFLRCIQGAPANRHDHRS